MAPPKPSKRQPSAPKPPSRWIGRLTGTPGVWFLAWGPTRAHVRRRVEADLGPVDATSIKRLEGAGYFLFRSTAKRPGVEPSPGEYLILYDEDAEAWIACVNGEPPTPEAPRRAASARAAPSRRR